MRLIIIFLAVTFVTVSGIPIFPVDPTHADDVIEKVEIEKYPYLLDSGIRDEVKKMWVQARWGDASFEMCGIVVRRYLGGDLKWVLDKPQKTVQTDAMGINLEWNKAGRAIIHTHPSRRGSMPSYGDRETAQKIGCPVFSISTDGVYGYDPRVNKVIRFWSSDRDFFSGVASKISVQ
jgi:hypothetical protein